MKKQRNLFPLLAAMMVVFAVIAALTFRRSNALIEQGYLTSEGSAARDFAVLTAANIHLTDAQVKQLKTCTYQELQASEENSALKKMLSTPSFAGRVDYAYVMVHLPADEVKYSVTEDSTDVFAAPVGTRLDILWLLDVAVNRVEEDHAEHTDVEERYSYYIEEDARIFAEAPTYILNKSEWGDHICGYAPLYSTSGLYIGVVGVELKTSDYEQYCGTAMRAMGLLLVVSTLTLLLFFVLMYFQYHRQQMDKIYTDPLTGLSNRSFYNDLFIRRLNGEHAHKLMFALLIADIDWFKKVNDTFGHEIGDEVLVEISAILLQEFGKGHIVRFGGEEFVAGLWVQDEAEVNDRLNHLYETLAQKKYSRSQIPITLSLGCSLCSCTELTGWLVSGMLKTADDTLYAVKENGRKAFRIVPYNGPTEPGDTAEDEKD